MIQKKLCICVMLFGITSNISVHGMFRRFETTVGFVRKRLKKQQKLLIKEKKIIKNNKNSIEKSKRKVIKPITFEKSNSTPSKLTPIKKSENKILAPVKIFDYTPPKNINLEESNYTLPANVSLSNFLSRFVDLLKRDSVERPREHYEKLRAGFDNLSTEESRDMFEKRLIPVFMDEKFVHRLAIGPNTPQLEWEFLERVKNHKEEFGETD